LTIYTRECQTPFLNARMRYSLFVHIGAYWCILVHIGAYWCIWLHKLSL